MAYVAQSGTRIVGQAEAASPNRLLIALLLISLVMPFFFFLGGLRLSMYRLYLLVFGLFFLIRWVNGSAGRLRTPDIMVIIASFWMMGGLFVNHGANRFEFAGILVIETIIPYLAARVLIRNLASFRTFVWWYFLIVALLLPFALYENKTGDPILLDFFRGILSVYADVAQEPRLGLERAQTTMPHPILFGVFCAPAFALTWYTLSPEGALFNQIRRPLVVGVAVFSSLSSGAFMGVLLQAFLIGWDEVLKNIKNRWKIFAYIFGALYVALELASNRNAFQIIATEMTFSPGSAWNRIHIFNHAIDDVFRNPIFGIGLGDWTRPHWLRPSVDNFWLLVALRYGILPWFLLTLSAVLICWKAIIAPLSGEHARIRRGYLIAFISMVVSAFTVHLWDATYCVFMFLMGAGVWLSDPECVQEIADEGNAPKTARRKIRYTRFPSPTADVSS
ncbi:MULTISPECIES: hypothetical protein [unclassified Ruegeria]|uniref:hypothetical protein n=1 Tax=unclassified Ruegeria TaxID=2625375 RepID=UPI001AEB946B|nr:MULTISPECIES: hypothetical protein [unclassified Ruegeria]